MNVCVYDCTVLHVGMTIIRVRDGCKVTLGAVHFSRTPILTFGFYLVSVFSSVWHFYRLCSVSLDGWMMEYNS